MDKDFDQVLEEFDQAAQAVAEYPGCPDETGALIFEFMAELHVSLANNHIKVADHLRKMAFEKFGVEIP